MLFLNDLSSIALTRMKRIFEDFLNSAVFGHVTKILKRDNTWKEKIIIENPKEKFASK